MKADEVGLGLGVGLVLGSIIGLLAESYRQYPYRRRANSAIKRSHFAVEGQ